MQLVKNPNVILRKIHSEYFLINIEEKYYEGNKALLEINETGKIIFEFLSTPQKTEDIFERVESFFSVPKEDKEMVKQDIHIFLNTLIEMDYLKNV